MKEMEKKPTQPAEVSEEELGKVAGGALFDDDGYMITTMFNSCEQWKCKRCGTYSGTADCGRHVREGYRFCTECKYEIHTGVKLRCTYWKEGQSALT